MLEGHPLVNRARDLIRLLAPRPIDLDQHHDLLAIVALYRKDRRRAGPHRGVGRLRCPLKLVGTEVAAADDEEVLEPSGDVELSAVQRSEVARAKKPSGLRFVGDPGAKTSAVASDWLQYPPVTSWSVLPTPGPMDTPN